MIKIVIVVGVFNSCPIDFLVGFSFLISFHCFKGT